MIIVTEPVECKDCSCPHDSGPVYLVPVNLAQYPFFLFQYTYTEEKKMVNNKRGNLIRTPENTLSKNN